MSKSDNRKKIRRAVSIEIAAATSPSPSSRSADTTREMNSDATHLIDLSIAHPK